MSVSFELSKSGDTGLRLAVLEDDDVVWPFPRSADDGGAIFDAEDVLSYLADAWPSLLLTEVWPDFFTPDQEPRSMTGLQRAADERWEQVTELDGIPVEAEAAALDDFLYRHNLKSMRMSGLLPDFFMLRQGGRYRFEVNGQVDTSCSYSDFVAQLERLGAFARDCLAAVGSAYDATIRRWDSRDEIDAATAVSYIAALRKEDLQEAPDVLASLHDRTLTEIANDNIEPLLAVARSSGALGPSGIVAALHAFRGIAPGSTAELDKRRRMVQAGVKSVANPTDQGIRASADIREWMRAVDAAFDLRATCQALCINVEERADLDSRIDGLASAGPKHGPAILLNRSTMRRGGSDADLDRALRFTWAHELGHLLLDDAEWPALIDSVQQRVPRWIETRANAFAAHLLLPPVVAYMALDEQRPHLTWDALKPALNDICARFQVTRIVASRQVFRGAPPERRPALGTVFRQHIPNFMA